MDTLIRSARILKEPLLLSTRSRKSVENSVEVGHAIEPVPEESVPVITGYSPEFAVGEERVDIPAHTDVQPDFAAAHYAAAAIESVGDEERELQWRQELEAAKEEARNTGFAEGFQAGTLAAEQEYTARLTELRALFQSASQALEEEIAGAEDLLVEVVFAAVTKIVGETMTTHEGVTAVVRQVVQHINAREHLVIRVSPQDLALLNEGLLKLGSGLEADRVKIIADDRVQLGGCLLETAGGNLDGRLEIQLHQLREILLKAKAQKAASGQIDGTIG